MNVIMIMAHQYPYQIFRLIQRCKTENTDVIVHLDLKAKQEDYDYLHNKISELYSNRGVYLMEERLAGELFNRILVDITMKMIDYVHNVEKQENKHYQYFLLCSGQDYPLKPMQAIEEELSHAYPKPFIDCTPYNKHNWMRDRFTNNTVDPVLKYLFTDRIKNSRSRIIKGILSRLLRYVKPFILKFGQNVEQRLKKQGIFVYGGSQWWIMPDIAIEYIAGQYYSFETKKYISLLLDETATPDETFFQTMVMRSPVKNKVQLNSVTERCQNNKTWSYWQDVNKPMTSHPYVIRAENFNQLLTSQAWFARKFDETIDSGILDKIDHELLNI